MLSTTSIQQIAIPSMLNLPPYAAHAPFCQRNLKCSLNKASNDMTSLSTHGCMICQWLRACALKKSGQNHQRLCKSLPSHVTIRVIVERNIYSVGTERWSGVDDRINLNPPKGLSGPLGCINCNKPPSNRMPADHQKGPTKVEVSRGDGVSYIRLGFWYRPKSP